MFIYLCLSMYVTHIAFTHLVMFCIRVHCFTLSCISCAKPLCLELPHSKLIFALLESTLPSIWFTDESYNKGVRKTPKIIRLPDFICLNQQCAWLKCAEYKRAA